MRWRKRDERDDAVGLVTDRWAASTRELMEPRRAHQLNDSFIHGDQWVRYNLRDNSVEHLAPEVTESGRERPRVTDNLLRPRCESLVGRLADSELQFESKISSADVSILHGARLARQVITAAWDTQGWEEIREEELTACLLGGTSAVLVERDRRAAPVSIEDRTNKAEVTDDVRLSALTIAEFGLEPGSPRFHDARWCVIHRAVPPEQVQHTYRLDWLPEADAASQKSPTQRRLIAGQGEDVRGRVDNLTSLYLYFERPNELEPEGREIVVAGGKVVRDEPWAYPFTDRLPLRVFIQTKVTGVWYGDTIVSTARPLQVEYNKLKSNIAEHADKVATARLGVPIGSIRSLDELTDEAGEYLEYNPANGGRPEYISPGEIARFLPKEIDRLEQSIDEILHTHAVARGAINPDRQSGLAISILAEKNDSPLGPMARNQARGWGEIASMVAKIYESSPHEHTSRIEAHPGVPLTFTWRGYQMRGQTDFRVPTEVTMPTSRAATQAAIGQLRTQFPELFENVPLDKIVRMLQLPNLDEFTAVLDSDAHFATQENGYMAVGEAQIPQPWHDHGKHIAEHNRFRNSRDFEMAPPEIQALFAKHIEAHEQISRDVAAMQAAANATVPGIGALPQGNRPPGSMVPIPASELRPGVQN